jgi:hypothetical protein
MAISEKFPKEYKIIECQKGKSFLPLEAIHGKILKLIESKLK